MSELLEQTSEAIADEKPEIVLQQTQVTDLPLHFKQCIELTSIPESIAPIVRCFYTTDGSVYLGVLLVETIDSFLVAAPIKLVMNSEKKIVSEEISSEPVIRQMKGGIKYIVRASFRSLYYYYTYLIKDGRIHLPELVNEEALNVMKAYIEDFVNKYGTEFNPNQEQERSKETKEANKFTFTPYQVSEKIH